MREILFRGKRIDNGEWVEGSLSTEYYHSFGDVMISPSEEEIYKVDPSTVGQCVSGLTDKNGKKIFEGDILKYSYHPLVLVVWHSGGWYFTDEDDPSMPHPDDFIDNWSCMDKENLEIIGNIHDNPELLEEQT